MKEVLSVFTFAMFALGFAVFFIVLTPQVSALPDPSRASLSQVYLRISNHATRTESAPLKRLGSPTQRAAESVISK